MSAAGVWPLLALLCLGGRRDLPEPNWPQLSGGPPQTSCNGMPSTCSVFFVQGLSTTAAMGIWTSEDTPLHDDWASQLPDGIVGKLTDQAALDRWAANETGGLIDRFSSRISGPTPR